MGDVTVLLAAAARGDSNADQELLAIVYEELREIASQRMSREQPGQTLQATALVHEAWLRLTQGSGVQFKNRSHFFGAASEAMRRIMVDRARRRRAAKRGGHIDRVNCDDVEIPCPGGTDDELLELNDVLERFAAVAPRKAELVKLRYFIGMTFPEASAVLGIAEPTAKQWWAFARAWLKVAIRESSTPPPEAVDPD